MSRRQLERSDHAARPRRRAGQGRRAASAARPSLLRPRPRRRSRLAAGRRRPGHHLDGLPDPQSGLPVAEQSGQPAVRLLDGRRHLARHRLRAAGRRDRPLGRLGERLASAILGVLWVNQGWPVVARDPRRARGRLPDRRALRAAVQPARHAKLRLDAVGPARVPRACSSTSSAPTGSINLPYGSPLVNFGQTLVMPRLVSLRAGAARRRRDVRRRAIARAARRRAAGLSSPSLGGLASCARRRASSCSRSSSPTSTRTAASRGCSACSSGSSSP